MSDDRWDFADMNLPTPYEMRRYVRRQRRRGLKVYIDLRDWWIGWYRGPNHHYICVLPTVVIRWRRHP